jgi:hypothetical protein
LVKLAIEQGYDPASNGGLFNSGVFLKSLFVPRGEAPAPKPAKLASSPPPAPAPRQKMPEQLHAQIMRERDLSVPIKQEQLDSDAYVARFNAADKDTKARMILDAGARSRGFASFAEEEQKRREKKEQQNAGLPSDPTAAAIGP